jgi:peptidoglycan/xylan/chitin deacetylase (PgdA/CDA1 family)
MRRAGSQPPFSERGGPVRGLVELAAGRYPSFLFGGRVAGLLPVFHLHESEPAVLESRLAYLAENGYRTVTTDAIARLVIDRVHPGPRTVALCFDDCWATLWTVAGPLLRSHGMSAIAFAIPGRMSDAEIVRPTTAENAAAARAADRTSVPFATWTELRQLQSSGLVDVQSHTLTHSAVFSGSNLTGFVSPDFARRPLLDRPLAGRSATWLTPDDLGAPLFPQRSRMSEALRFFDDSAARERCVNHVAASGGAAFFTRPGWEAELKEVLGNTRGEHEAPGDRSRAILAELADARAMLKDRLGTDVRHVCLPWGIAGSHTRDALARTGHQLAFADRLLGRRAVAAGDDPHSLMRLHERFIMCLPGRGRRFFFTAV